MADSDFGVNCTFQVLYTYVSKLLILLVVHDDVKRNIMLLKWGVTENCIEKLRGTQQHIWEEGRVLPNGHKSWADPQNN